MCGEAVSHVEYCVQLKITIQTVLSEQVHYYGEVVTCWIADFAGVYYTLHSRDISAAVFRKSVIDYIFYLCFAFEVVIL
jgi:hypothetical protein